MLDAVRFLATTRDFGFDFVTGVPCSHLTPLIDAAAGAPGGWVVATSEGEAVAIAAGAWLAGRTPMVLMQNSGLGNAVNPLTSLSWPFAVPALLVVSRRGAPGEKDEPQHGLMGPVTLDLLDLVGVVHEPLPSDDEALAAALGRALRVIGDERRPFAFVVGRDGFAKNSLDGVDCPVPAPGRVIDRRGGCGRPPRMTAMARALTALPDDSAVIATTGHCGRELFTLGDAPRFLFMVGAMGGASATALGVALCVDRPVVVFDGDGAALMKLGNLATIGARAPRRLIHVIFDNERHVSTGGQRTVSAGVDFAAVAAACGYPVAIRCDDLPGFEAAVAEAARTDGPVLIHAKVGHEAVSGLGRPTVEPRAVADRFRAFLNMQAVR